MSERDCVLPHYLLPGLRLVFVGYNPGLESARAGHYYAHPGNAFWRHLSASGLVERDVSSADDGLLAAEAGIGFVDLCCRPTARAEELTPAELSDGASRLRGEIVAAAPRFAVFGGRGLYHAFARHALGVSAAELGGRPDGLQPDRVRGAASTRLFVTPSSSGLASRWHRRRLELLRELATMLRQEPASRVRG